MGMTAWFYSDNVKASMNGIDSISRENLYDSNGNMTVDGYHGLTLEYNALDRVSRVKSGTLTKVSYSYLADGTKVSALDASGNGLLYSGSRVFRKEGSVRSAESVGYSGGRFVADSSGVLRPQIHVVDHLGSVRAIVDKSGNVVERDSYYPYGERWNDGSVEQADNRYRYNGKESQSDFGLPYLDYGARLYDPATGRWLTQDPMAEKYYGISPYAFCAGNPMKYVDADGMRIFPKGQEELDMIRNTLPIADREYVNIDKNGYIDATLINNHSSLSDNYNLLQELVNSELIINVVLGTEIQAQNNNGQLYVEKLSYTGFDEYFIDSEFQITSGLSTGETGKFGLSLLPGKGSSEVNSIDEKIYVLIHTSLSIIGRAEAYSHEANGHVIMYNRTHNREAAAHQAINFTENNIPLKQLILKSRKETVYNMQKK